MWHGKRVGENRGFGMEEREEGVARRTAASFVTNKTRDQRFRNPGFRAVPGRVLQAMVSFSDRTWGTWLREVPRGAPSEH